MDGGRTHRTSRRDILAGSLGLGLAGALGPLAGRPALAQTPKRGGTLRVALPPAPNLDPLKMEAAGAIAIVQQVAEYLVWVEPDLSLRPVLATSWSTPDGGKTWVFDIRQGVKFHDGRDLTADDVVASFQRMVDPTTASAAAAQLSFLKKEHVKKVGDYKVQFDLERPIGQFPYYTNVYNALILPHDYDGDWQKNPVGTGPFRVKSLRPQEGATLVRNETYWDQGKPYLDGVEIQLYESPQAMILALQGKQADMVLNASFIDARSILSDPDLDVVHIQAPEHRQLTMRCDQKPFDDKRVRQAVALCLNRPALIKGLFGGFADLGNDHPIAPIYPEKVELKQREQNVAEAKKLLAAAGYPQGFEVDLYTEQYIEVPQYAQFIKQMLEPAGIRVNLHIEPLNTYYDHWTKVGFGLTDWAGRPTAIQILSVAFKGGAEWNAAHWKNDEFDGLLGQIEAEVDQGKRAKLLERAAAIMNDEVPAVIGYFTNNLRPVSKRVAGVPGSISQFLDLTKAHLV
jgi:peptide/nickel transport system substrate-binding protein